MLKSTLFCGTATISRAAIAVALNKLVAVWGGPSAVALLGNAQNLFAALWPLSTGGTALGLVKYLAEYRLEPERQRSLISSGIVIAIPVSLCISAILISGRTQFSQLLFFSHEFEWVFILAGAGILGSTGYQLAVCWFNGQQQFASYAAISTFADLATLAIAICAAPTWDWQAAIIGLALGPPAAFVALLLVRARKLKGHSLNLLVSAKLSDGKKLGHFSIMAIASLAILHGTQLIVRNQVVATLGAHQAGIWQALWFLCDAGVGLAVAFLAPLLLPQFSSASKKEQLVRLVLHIYRIMIPLLLACSMLLYIYRRSVIALLFSQEFSEAAEAFDWLLVGGGTKLASWVLGFLLIARARINAYIGLEIIFSIAFIALTIPLAEFYGIRGVAIAYASSYLIYMALVVGYFITDRE